MKTIFTLLICLPLFYFPSFGQPGSLDVSFSLDGKVKTDFANDDDLGSSIAIQPDGKILVAGSTWANTARNDFALVVVVAAWRLLTIENV